MELITTIYQVLFLSYFYFSSKCLYFKHLFSDSRIILCKRKFSITKSSNLPIQLQEKIPLHFYSFGFQMIKENQQSYLNPSIKYSHALFNHRDTFSEKHHWGILLCKRHRVHLHKPRRYSPLHTPRLHGILPVVSSSLSWTETSLCG